MMTPITRTHQETTTVKGALEKELARQAQVGAALRAQKEAGSTQVLRVNHQGRDEVAMAMNTTGLLSAQQQDDMRQRRIRHEQWNALEEAKGKQFRTHGTDEVAIGMEPPSLVAHLRRAK
jgi:hypothetical protein